MGARVWWSVAASFVLVMLEEGWLESVPGFVDGGEYCRSARSGREKGS
jgi:hypothetical protein